MKKKNTQSRRIIKIVVLVIAATTVLSIMGISIINNMHTQTSTPAGHVGAVSYAYESLVSKDPVNRGVSALKTDNSLVVLASRGEKQNSFTRNAQVKDVVVQGDVLLVRIVEIAGDTASEENFYSTIRIISNDKLEGIKKIRVNWYSQEAMPRNAPLKQVDSISKEIIK